jgi:hypothetical protein
MVDCLPLVHRVLDRGRMADSLVVALISEAYYIVIDWALIVAVIVLVIAVYWAIGQVIDACLGMWRSREDDL